MHITAGCFNRLQENEHRSIGGISKVKCQTEKGLSASQMRARAGGHKRAVTAQLSARRMCSGGHKRPQQVCSECVLAATSPVNAHKRAVNVQLSSITFCVLSCSMMLNKDPDERATVKELLSHKWFKVGLFSLCACSRTSSNPFIHQTCTYDHFWVCDCQRYL